MVRQHLQLHLKMILKQMLVEQADGQNHCARATRTAEFAAQKNSREIVNKRDRTEDKRRLLTYKRHVLINKRRL